MKAQATKGFLPRTVLLLLHGLLRCLQMLGLFHFRTGYRRDTERSLEDPVLALADDVIGRVCPDELRITFHHRKWLVDSDVVCAVRFATLGSGGLSSGMAAPWVR
jgi:hypothetical protein